MKDTLIIEHLRRGDEEAFKYIYEHHYVLLCRFANQILNDAALSEEVVDDAIFYLWEHRREIEITYSVRAYLMRAVRNRCLNELQSLSHREELHFSSFYAAGKYGIPRFCFCGRESALRCIARTRTGR